MKNIIPERFFAALAVKRYIERNLMKKKKQIEEQTEEQTEGKPKKKGPSVSTIILVVILVVGMGILLYPSVSDWWNSMHATQAIAGYSEAVEQLSGQEKEAILNEARAYNESLANGVNFNLTDDQFEEYTRILDITGTGIMGYLQIPVIGVNLPTYHTVDEAVLQIAMGHVPGSSLPVGGERTHCVMSGHRGLPSAKLFTDLDRLGEGDYFQLKILNETLTYEVDQIRIVLPVEVSELGITQGQDYCTLVTCTPYGINSHRMLVRGRRIANPREAANITSDAIRVDPVLVAPAMAAPMLIVLTVWLIVDPGGKKKKKQKKRTKRKKRGEPPNDQEDPT